jgi:prepilin signal peptidase PulO-like enzyme (type II secretory pathway)
MVKWRVWHIPEAPRDTKLQQIAISNKSESRTTLWTGLKAKLRTGLRAGRQVSLGQIVGVLCDSCCLTVGIGGLLTLFSFRSMAPRCRVLTNNFAIGRGTPE